MNDIVDFVVRHVGNSYESYRSVIDETLSWANEEGRNCSEAVVADAIAMAIKEELITTHRMDNSSKKLIPSAFDRKSMDDFWLHASERARREMGLTSP